MKSPRFDPRVLRQFIEDEDRERPLFFAGRAKEIRGIRDKSDHVGRGRMRGQTRIITGAPGAGKTALLSQLQALWEDDQEVRVVRLAAEVFSYPEEAIGEFLLQLDPGTARRAGATVTDTAGGRVGVSGKILGVLGAEGSVHKARAMQRSHTPRSFRSASNLLPERIRERTIVVLVDEAQDWAPNRTERPEVPRSDLLNELHMGEHGLKLLLVAAGLGTTEDRFMELGLSRLSADAVQVLDCLSDTEQREAVDRFFEHFHVRGDAQTKARWAEALVDGAQGWPHHLTNGLRAAAEELIRAEGDADYASLDAACTRATEYREHYYSRRIGRLAGMPAVLSAVFGVLDSLSGVSKRVLNDAISNAYEGDARLTKEMDEDDVLGEMQRSGLIQKDWKHLYRCPIPSLQHYVVDFCRAQDHSIQSNLAVNTAERKIAAPERQ